jgi:hypothetical protein
MDVTIDTFAEQPASARILLRALFEDDEFDGADWPEGQALDRRLSSVLEGLARLINEGMKSGALRKSSTPHVIQTLIGATIYHFASGELGDVMLGGTMWSAEAVRARKAEMKAFLHHGLAPRPVESAEGEGS